MQSEPYFFKVKKLQFRPNGCDEEMEFIQIGWPIELDDLYESSTNKFSFPKKNVWSGPMFNKWATEESATGPCNESTSTTQGLFDIVSEI